MAWRRYAEDDFWWDLPDEGAGVPVGLVRMAAHAPTPDEVFWEVGLVLAGYLSIAIAACELLQTLGVH